MIGLRRVGLTSINLEVYALCVCVGACFGFVWMCKLGRRISTNVCVVSMNSSQNFLHAKICISCI